ncbi:hypothetical protein ACSBR1_002552 [Camellia fascicularis]
MAAGILSNNLGEIYMKDSFGPEYELLAFWAPMMLLHSGGTDAITAYSLEDNELCTVKECGFYIGQVTTNLGTRFQISLLVNPKLWRNVD